MSRLAIVLVALVLLPAPASSSSDSVLAAFDSGDAVGIERAAITTSAATLIDWLESDERRTVLAAAIAAPSIDEGPHLLGALGRAAHSPDRSIAVTAARSALAIVRNTDSERLATLEVLRVTLADALRTWHELARDGERWADVRVMALEITAALARELAGKPAAAVIELTGDGDEEIRLAAFELLPSPLPAVHAERVATAIGSETVPRVALAAAVSLCSGLAFGDDSEAVTKLSATSREALARLILEPSLPAALRVEAARCARVLGMKDVITALIKSLPRSLATSARGLLEAP